MKFLVVAVALVAVAVAAPAAPSSSDQVAVILRSEFDQQPDGAFQYAFETDNGIKREEVGTLKQVTDEDNKPQNVVVVRGQYSYTDTDGKTQTITYTADETGFHPEGDAIPKPARK